MTGLMAGKRGLIMGLANDKSLAWGIGKKVTLTQRADNYMPFAWISISK